MFTTKNFIWFLLLISSFNVLEANGRAQVYYAQDYCHYATINKKIYVNEDQPSIILRASRGQYKPDLDCQLRIVNDGKQNTGLNVNIKSINLRHFSKFKDYLSFKFDDKRTNLWFDERLIGNNNEKEEFFYTTKSDQSDEVVIKLQTTADDYNHQRDEKNFEIIITLFWFEDSNVKNRNNDQNCEQRYLFDCGNNICIQRKFFCDGIHNCGNGWDEPDNCKHSRRNNYFDLFDSGFWFGFKIVMSLLLIGILLGIISCICKKCDENKKLKKQFLLEELNRQSGYRLRGNSIYSLNPNKTPLYPQLYRTYGGTQA